MRKIVITLLIILTSFSSAGYGSSTIFLKITKNLQEKAEVVLMFGMKEDIYWSTLIKTLQRDLEYSGYFTVEKSLFVEALAVSKKRYTTQFIITGEKTSDGINVKVEDLLDEKILFEKGYKRSGTTPSFLAHRINNDIVFYFTGKPGIALSKILFVSDSTGKYQIYSIDYDGENLTRLTDAGYMVHYPRWLIPHREILYVSYKDGWAKLMKMDLKTGEDKMLIGEPGINACASPCLKTGELAVVLSKSGRPNIYIYGLDGDFKRRITSGSSIDASPSFSPCGSMLAFVSDRYGSPQIYTMTKEGFRTKRVSFISGYSTSPAWSPDGRYIAYVFMRGGSFGIAVYEPSSGETKIIGENLGSEDISWAPDSRHLVYSSIKSKPTSLVIIDMVTGEKRLLNPDRFNSFSPNWSSLY
jgi:TolB protein